MNFKTPGSVYLRGVLFALTLLVGNQPSPAAGPVIPAAVNLAEAGKLSHQQGIPVIVFVSRDACPYCRTLRNSVLGPMFAAGKFEQTAILLEVSLDSSEPMTGFDGGRLTAQGFGEVYDAEITPTLLFLDYRGREVGKRLIGISNLELYGYYLQQSTEEAADAVRSESRKG